MSKEVDENYFEEFFVFLDDVMGGKYPYREIFKKYKIEEILDIIAHSTSTLFMTLSRMDVEMNFVINLLHLIRFIKTGENEYRNLDAVVNMYNKMTNLIVRELYFSIKQISEMGIDEEKAEVFKSMVRDIEEIINERDDFNADTTTK